MRGEKKAHAIQAGKVGNGGLTENVARAAAARVKRKESADLRGGLTHGITMQAYRQYETDSSVSTSGTSIFDPVLCELIYRWFCPPGGLVLDPFAGGSVRGVVASRLGRRYLGIDLRAEQVEANEAQLGICLDPLPQWLVGDAIDIESLAAEHAGEVDMLFSCPPYGNLEVYSDHPADLSALDDAEFDAAYARIIGAACALLAPDRFACFVVGDYRDERGFYRNLPGRTVAAFEAAGCRLYNEAILLTAVGSLPVRARKQFVSTRKLGKTHQNVLVFCNGDPRRAAGAVGVVQFGNASGLGDDAEPAV